MSFAAPVWLLFLLPWLALSLWLLIGQRNRVSVPFLELWSGPVTAPSIRRKIQPPPAALACALAALLLAIIGAAGPMGRAREAGSGVILIVDRGLTMAGRPRPVISQIQPQKVILVPTWSGLAADRSNWNDAPPSAITTSTLLRDAVVHELANSSDPVVVLSDQELDVNNPRLIQIGPDSTPQNVDLVRVAASVSPKPQVMVRLRNQSNLKSCQIIASSAGQSVTKAIDLPPMDAEQNFFLELPRLDDQIEVKLIASDDLRADNVAWLVRQRLWPKIEARTDLPDELRRMIEVYQKNRPATDQSPHIAISQDASQDQPGVLISSGPFAKPTSGGAEVKVAESSVVAGIDWHEVAQSAVVSEPPGAGWTPLVQAGSQIFVATREAPARQIWIGFTSPDFAKRADYVIFWTNVFDFVGQGGDEFAAEPVHAIGPEWKLDRSSPMEAFDLPPGVYKRADGARIAMNASDVRFPAPVKVNGQHRLASLPRSTASALDLRSPSLLVALLLLLASVLLWKRQPQFSG